MRVSPPRFVLAWSMCAFACTGGGNFGSANGAVDRAVSSNASEEALLELQTQVITAQYANRCQVAQGAMTRFRDITTRNSRLNADVVATVRDILERLVVAFCSGGDAGVGPVFDAGPAPIVDSGTVPPVDAGPRDTGVASDSGSSGGGGGGNLWMCGSATCGYCVTGRNYLMGQGIQFTYHNLGTNAGTDACWAAVMERGQSRVSMPTFGCRGRGTPIFGWNQQSWASLAAQCQ